MSIPTEENFLSDVSKHSMKVLHDDGLYRHLNFSNNGSFNQQFDIITFPGYLVYSGDMGCYTFKRLEDMFGFFRHGQRGSTLSINPGYWEEKLQSFDRDGSKEYSPKKFKDMVEEHINEWIEEFEGEYDSSEEELEKQRAEFATQLRDVVEDCIISYADDSEYKVHEALRDFSFDYEDKFIKRQKYEFSDTWEWDLKDYTYRYIWCCYAIVYAIQLYDAFNQKETR
jgi:hypothetical protein